MANGSGKAIHVRLDHDLDALIESEMASTGWTRSEVCRYLLRRAADMRISPQEAGAHEGYVAGIAAFRESIGQLMSETFRAVQERLR